jgi:hypothetical protein
VPKQQHLDPNAFARTRAANDQAKAFLAEAKGPLMISYVENGERVSKPILKQQVVVFEPERRKTPTPPPRPVAPVRRRSTPRPREAAPSGAASRGGDGGDKPRPLADQDDSDRPLARQVRVRGHARAPPPRHDLR